MFEATSNLLFHALSKTVLSADVNLKHNNAVNSTLYNSQNFARGALTSKISYAQWTYWEMWPWAQAVTADNLLSTANTQEH